MRQRLSALLIDPFADESDIYALYLRAKGFDVIVAADAEDRCDAALRSVPHVVVTRLRQNHTMLTGVQITERVKQHPATQHVPVVVISTSMLASDREAALAAGCDRYVSLPCTPEDLVVVLRRVIAAK